MNQPELIEFLSQCVRALKVCGDIGINISDDIIDKIHETLPKIGVVPGFFKLIRDNYEDKIVPIMTDEEIQVARTQGKIDAIKMYKQRTGLFLLDSKHAVEEYMKINHYSFVSKY